MTRSYFDDDTTAANGRCGVPAGYRQHLRMGEDPCASCKEVMAQYATARNIGLIDTPTQFNVTPETWVFG